MIVLALGLVPGSRGALTKRPLKGLGVPEQIGFIGLGVSGQAHGQTSPVAAGHPPGRSQPQPRRRWTSSSAAGATAAASPAEVARQSTVVITMLPDTPDVERVLDGPDGVLAAIQTGAVVIDMSSISPVATRAARRRWSRERAASMLDAPVSGGEIGAINATLSIMVGGDEAAFDARAADPRGDGQPGADRPHRPSRAPGRSARSATRSRSAARSPASAKRSRSRRRPASTRRRCGRRCSAASRRAACSKCTASGC
mgnify:CR=1 FL=1